MRFERIGKWRRRVLQRHHGDREFVGTMPKEVAKQSRRTFASKALFVDKTDLLHPYRRSVVKQDRLTLVPSA